MGRVAIEKQVRLPLSRAVEIAVRSLRVRLGGSVVTLVTIVMAIAFLTNVWTTRQVEGALARAAGVAEAKASGEGVAVAEAKEAPEAATGVGDAGKGGPSRTIWLL